MRPIQSGVDEISPRRGCRNTPWKRRIDCSRSATQMVTRWRAAALPMVSESSRRPSSRSSHTSWPIPPARAARLAARPASSARSSACRPRRAAASWRAARPRPVDEPERARVVVEEVRGGAAVGRHPRPRPPRAPARPAVRAPSSGRPAWRRPRRRRRPRPAPRSRPPAGSSGRRGTARSDRCPRSWGRRSRPTA